MTLEELENTRPNGLHDAEIKRVSVDYERRSVAMELDVWVESRSDPPETRKAYRRGLIEISGLLFLVMEPPDPKYPFETADLRIDGCDLRKNLDSSLLNALSKEAFFRSLWVSEWNAFIHIAATEAQITWYEPTVYRSGNQQLHPKRHIAPDETIGT